LRLQKGICRFLIDQSLSCRADCGAAFHINTLLRSMIMGKHAKKGNKQRKSSDLLYGGITYGVRIADGIAVGQSVRIMSGHYHPDRCSIVMVDYVV
jgi:hypothetical protein